MRHTRVMAGKRSAGIMLYRIGRSGLEILIGHMGGPFWERKDSAAWSIPKGEYDPVTEEPECAARREFQEELGLAVPPGELVALGEIKQSGGKIVTVWALEGDLDPAAVTPGTFEMQWPPGSGRFQHYPELDRVQWFAAADALDKLVVGQRVFIARLEAALI